MQVKVENWKVSKLFKLKSKINEQPEYQRGDVWQPQKKKILIDSILRGIDIPKIYLRKLENSAFNYEVADGQQRINALYSFIEDTLRLSDKFENGLNLAKIGDEDVSNLTYTELPQALRDYFDNYSLTVAIVENATGAEIRTLFGRLQLGSQLNPAEKRNAILSSVGDHINNFALNHTFFIQSKIPKSRYKHQDYLAHVFALIEYQNKQDLKADLLNALYLDKKVYFSQKKLSTVDKVLDYLAAIDSYSSRHIVNKFAFIDLFWMLHKNVDTFNTVDARGLAERYDDFEESRLSNNDNPKQLIQGAPSALDKHLYDYILAFNFAGSSTTNINTRNRVFNHLFKKYLK